MSVVSTLDQLANKVLNYLDEAGDTDTTRDVIYDTIRSVHASRVVERKWNFMLWDTVQPITTVVGQKFYSLHQEFFRPLYFYNRTSNRTMVQKIASTLIPTDGVVDYDSGLGIGDWTDQSGEALGFMFGSVSPVQNQPTSASVLTVTGEAAKTVTVKGETSDGDVASEIITVGTPGTIQFTRIIQVTKGDGWTQTMTITANAAAVTVLKLRANEYGRQYRQLELVNEPTAAESLVYKFFRQPSALDSANAIPDIPAPFSELLVYDALLQLAVYNSNLSAAARALWKEEQFRLEQGLLEFDEGPDSLGAAVSYQPYTPRD